MLESMVELVFDTPYPPEIDFEILNSRGVIFTDAFKNHCISLIEESRSDFNDKVV
jgi:hypothetical protein